MKIHRSHCFLTWSAFAAGAVFVISPTLPAQEEYRPAAAGGYSMEAIDRLDPELQTRIRQIERLTREGMHAEAGKLRDALQSEMAEKMMLEQSVRLPESEDSKVVRKPDRPEPPVSPEAKIRHLRVAAENLAAAGYRKLAAEARAEINRLEVEMAESSDPVAQLRREVKQLRRELERLRQQIRKLQMERLEPEAR